MSSPPDVLPIYHQHLAGLRQTSVYLRADAATLIRRDINRGRKIYARGLPSGPNPWWARIRALAAEIEANTSVYDLILDTDTVREVLANLAYNLSYPLPSIDGRAALALTLPV
jgi:hypothetical protein